MKRSSDRILTTHTGSLPRPDDLAGSVEGKAQHEIQHSDEFEDQVRGAVRRVVEEQVSAGIDIVNDGEVSKVGYSTYVTERLTGFGAESRPPRPNVETADFPGFYAQGTPGAAVKRPVCTGPIAWTGSAYVQRDIDNLRAAVGDLAVADVFMTAASPGVVWHFLENDYYPNDEQYIEAVAEAMSNEYRAIVDAGFLLQLDCPDLAMGWNRFNFAGKPEGDFLKVAAMHVEALNAAIAGIPADRVRLHLCWGNFEGPHVRDIPLARIWEIAVTARAGAFSFEAANPRHEHEWTLFERVQLPDGAILIPGVLDSTTNFVEHPALVAQRLVRYGGLVGRENVIAGTDCGFSTFARSQPIVHPSVAWAKMRAMAEGARLASEELWGTPSPAR